VGQRRLAVIDVGDDREIADRAGHRIEAMRGGSRIVLARQGPVERRDQRPELGGFASRAIFTPCSRSAALHTGPMEATSVRLKLAASGPSLPSFWASANRLCACDALVNTVASTSPRSSAAISPASGPVFSGSAQR